jgi:hypothetical protein
MTLPATNLTTLLLLSSQVIQEKTPFDFMEQLEGTAPDPRTSWNSSFDLAVEFSLTALK